MRLTGGGEARRGAGGKKTWLGPNVGYAPAREVLIEDRGVKKHGVHIRNAADIPAAYILIEAILILKHFSHIVNPAGTASSGDGVIRLNLGDRPYG